MRNDPNVWQIGAFKYVRQFVHTIDRKTGCIIVGDAKYLEIVLA